MITLGVDLGTTRITALAWDGERIIASETVANDGGEDADRVVARAIEALDAVARRDVAAIGVTGQQHGMVLVDPALRPLGPFVGWQDRRGDDFVEDALARLGDAAPERAGCRLRSGFMGTTLFRLSRRGELPPPGAVACFIPDLLVARLVGGRPVTDPTLAASSGLFDVRRREWDDLSIDALGLPRWIFPEVIGATEPRGRVEQGTLAGVPVCGAIGDCQAAYLGSGAGGLFVNVGTGAQVAARVERYAYAPPLETRPLPGAGYLRVGATSVGGARYAEAHRHLRLTVPEFDGLEDGALYERMNALAADGGNSVCRAALEEIAEALHALYVRLRETADALFEVAVCGGNAVRKNPALRSILSGRLGLPLRLAPHPEEAAVGAARHADRIAPGSPLSRPEAR